jgi:hypothetical protein
MQDLGIIAIGAGKCDFEMVLGKLGTSPEFVRRFTET